MSCRRCLELPRNGQVLRCWLECQDLANKEDAPGSNCMVRLRSLGFLIVLSFSSFDWLRSSHRCVWFLKRQRSLWPHRGDFSSILFYISHRYPRGAWDSLLHRIRWCRLRWPSMYYRMSNTSLGAQMIASAFSSLEKTCCGRESNWWLIGRRLDEEEMTRSAICWLRLHRNFEI